MGDEESFSAAAPGDEESGGSIAAWVATGVAVATPVAFALYFYYLRRRNSKSELDDILACDGRVTTTKAGDATNEDDFFAVQNAPWPSELPGSERIEAYEELKAAEPLDRTKLRHALMDRCQAHVAWLLRLEKEQRSMERLSRRGMISSKDYSRFCKFADALDAEVTAVREEAAWLCDDPSKAAQAADEIWRIAVQIWHQRRQQEQQQKQPDPEQLRAKERDDSRRAKARAAEAKRSLRGLKGGFLGSGGEKKKNGATTSTKRPQPPATEKKKDPPDQDGAVAAFEATKWPAELPCAGARARYDKLKKQTLAEAPPEGVPEGPLRQRLRQALMERCQHHVGFVRFVEQEQHRARAALERAKWRSGEGAPSSEDLGKLQAMDALAKQEMELVQAEAEWLGDPSGEPGMGDRIWPTAFDLDAQMRQRRELQERHQRALTERTLKAYASREAKPWPKQLPGAKQRADYETAKAAALRSLPQAAQHAMLQGRPAQHVIGPQHTADLRTLLMQRCLQCVPTIQRLQGEAPAVEIAASRGHVDDQELKTFRALDAAVKQEIDAVKQEADWLADETGTRKMGDSVWQAAFKLHAEKRQAVMAKLKEQQQQQQPPPPPPPPPEETTTTMTTTTQNKDEAKEDAESGDI